MLPERTRSAHRQHGNGERGSAHHAPDPAWILLQLPLPCSVRLGGAGAAHRVASQLLPFCWPQGVAPHADLRGAPLHLEQFPTGRVQAGKVGSRDSNLTFFFLFFLNCHGRKERKIWQYPAPSK